MRKPPASRQIVVAVAVTWSGSMASSRRSSPSILVRRQNRTDLLMTRAPSQFPPFCIYEENDNSLRDRTIEHAHVFIECPRRCFDPFRRSHRVSFTVTPRCAYPPVPDRDRDRGRPQLV